jgi:hypothetical protein
MLYLPCHPSAESFDISCMGGVEVYHAMRSSGKVHPGVLASIHLRMVDFEVCCQGEVCMTPAATATQ